MTRERQSLALKRRKDKKDKVDVGASVSVLEESKQKLKVLLEECQEILNEGGEDCEEGDGQICSDDTQRTIFTAEERRVQSLLAEPTSQARWDSIQQGAMEMSINAQIPSDCADVADVAAQVISSSDSLNMNKLPSFLTKYFESLDAEDEPASCRQQPYPEKEPGATPGLLKGRYEQEVVRRLELLLDVAEERAKEEEIRALQMDGLIGRALEEEERAKAVAEENKKKLIPKQKNLSRAVDLKSHFLPQSKGFSSVGNDKHRFSKKFIQNTRTEGSKAAPPPL